MFKTIDLYKALTAGEKLMPTVTGFDWWENVYTSNSAVYDREFVRRYSDFLYDDFMGADEIDDSKADFKADILSILTLNQKKYAEMYRIFVLTDADMPITYNYDMTETYGATKTTSVKGSQTNTIGSHTDTIGAITDTHKTAPFDSNTFQNESQDETASRSDTYGQRSDTDGQRTDTVDTNAVTNTRRGNIGVQTAADVADSFVRFFDNRFKFMLMIFEDIYKQLLLIGD